VKAPRGQQEDEGGGIFPFLSVLCCTLGALILILAAGAIQVMGISTEVNKAVSDSQVEESRLDRVLTQIKMSIKARRLTAMSSPDTLHRRAQALKASISSLRTSLKLSKQDLSSRSKVARNISARNDRITRLLRQLKALSDSVNSLERDRAAALGALAAVDAKIGSTQKSLDQLRSELNNVDQEKQQLAGLMGQHQGIRLMGQGEDKLPIFVELHQNSLTEHRSDGSEPFPKPMTEDLAGLLRRVNKLAKSMDDTRVMVLLVRPGEVDTFRVVASALRRTGVVFCWEPVDDEWPVSWKSLYVDPKPQN
jgi:hypothetical protein